MQAYVAHESLVAIKEISDTIGKMSDMASTSVSAVEGAAYLLFVLRPRVHLNRFERPAFVSHSINYTQRTYFFGAMILDRRSSG